MSTPEGNTGKPRRQNPPRPGDAEIAWMKQHGIHWHARGGWARKFPGDKDRIYYGRTSGAEAIRANAAEENRRKRGEEPAMNPASLTVSDAANMFLASLDRQHATGKIGSTQRSRYGRELTFLADTTLPGGDVPIVGGSRKLSDFCKLTAPEELFRPIREAAMARGISAAEKTIVQIRTFLDWCSTTRRFMPAPFYADAFELPAEKEKRAVKKAEVKEKGAAFWTPGEIREIVSAAKDAGPHRYAQVLLALNGGMGATDLSNLDDADIDWKAGCIRTDRSKTLVARVVPLWDITASAMKASRAERPSPAADGFSARFFLTRRGRPLVEESLVGPERKLKRTDSLKNWFYVMMHGAEKTRAGAIPRLAHLSRHKAGFYTLRACFLELARGHGGDPNLDAIIAGQKLSRGVLEHYLRGDMLAKLRIVTEHIRSQIWPGF